MNKTNAQSARNIIRNQGSFVIFLLICLIAVVFVPNFARFQNFVIIVKQAAIPTIALVGMTLVLMTGGIDLSLGYNLGLCSIVLGLMVKSWEFPIWFSIASTLLTGTFVGLINGICVQVIKVPAFIATLGTGYIVLGAAQIVSSGAAINRLPKALLAIGKTPVGPFNTTVMIALIVCLVFYYVLHMSTFGRSLFAFGLSEPASRMAGVDTGRVNMMVYIVCGFLAGLAGVLLTIDVNCAQPTMGGGDYTFTVITGAVLGGISLYGGVGSVLGAAFGMLTLKVINNCINLMNAAYYLSSAIMGIIILSAIIFENVKNRKL